MKPYPPRLFYSFMVVFAMAIFFSCTKTEDALRPSAEATTAETEQKFFTQHRSNDAVENALVNYIKQQNNQLHFVEKTVKQIGYPRWDKAITIAQKKGIISSFGPDGDSTTLYYIPFVRDSQNYVNASMVIAAAPADTSFWYYCDWQYRSLPYASTGTTAFTAERYAMFFMFMDSITLGHSRFKINDTLLFRSPGHSHTEKVIGVKTVSSSGRGDGGGGTTANSNSQGCIDWYYCGTPDWCQANYGTNGCDYTNCPTDECHLYTEYCFDLPESGGGEGGFPDEPIPIEPGGGGNGGGGGGTPSDCDEPQGRGIAARGNLPCDEGPGWEPEPIEDPPADPCDPFMTALGAHTAFAGNFKDLANVNNQTLTFEKGTFVTNLAGSQFLSIEGEPGSPSIQLAGVTIQLDGFLHTHSNALNQAPMFSPDDVLIMAETYLAGQAKDSNNLFFGIAHGYGPPYLMKVTNTTKFRKFAEKIIKMEQNEKDKDKFSEKFKEKFSSSNPNQNEKGFLDMLRNLGAGTGLTLYRAEDNDCKKWIKLERDNFSTSGIAEINCN